jgi:hypothetical protein
MALLILAIFSFIVRATAGGAHLKNTRPGTQSNSSKPEKQSAACFQACWL